MTLLNFRNLLVISSSADLKLKISELKNEGKSIGFVPTMGALHVGHASLMQKSINENEVTIVSIFVNPRQFNNPEDLLKYPRTTDSDIELAQNVNVDIVFLPQVEDVYPIDFVVPKVNLGKLEELMEGSSRPGHFDGVVQVLSRFFDLVQPNRAYFGLKDFQQVAVVQKMVKELNLPVEIIPCPIHREDTGLAFSSRNKRLSEDEKVEALFIHQSLLKAKELSKEFTPKKVMENMTDLYAQSSLKLEYFTIVDPLTLETLEENWVNGAVACVVAYVGEVRLIDNMELK